MLKRSLIALLAFLSTVQAQTQPENLVTVGEVATPVPVPVEREPFSVCEDRAMAAWGPEEGAYALFNLRGHAGETNPFVACYSLSEGGDWRDALAKIPSWELWGEWPGGAQGSWEHEDVFNEVRAIVIEPENDPFLMIAIDPAPDETEVALEPYAQAVLFAAMDYAMAKGDTDFNLSCANGYNPGNGAIDERPDIPLASCKVNLEIDLVEGWASGHVVIETRDGRELILP